ncbi:MAG: YfbM family protein [Acidobacteriota bacterium]
MGMYLGLVSISDEGITQILSDPPLVWKVVSPDDPEIYEEARYAKTSWFSRLFAKKASSQEELKVDIKREEDVDVDKAWHGIHYLLTGTAWEGEFPLNFLVAGGTEVGDIDLGYGVARTFRSDAVSEINAALSEIDEQTLRTRFNPQQMTKLQIYPDIWDRDSDEDDTFGYCAEYFQILRNFVTRVAERNLGVVVYIS